jgi:hypothetical protein
MLKSLYEVLDEGTPVYHCRRTGTIITVSAHKLCAWKPHRVHQFRLAGQRLVSFGEDFLHMGDDGQEDILVDAAKDAAEQFYKQEVNP